MTGLIFSLLLACSDPFADAQKQDTIEAYEKYIAENPTGSSKMIAENRLSDLMTEKARKDKTLPAYDAVIKRFPKHKEIKKLKEERIQVAYAEAEATATAEGWKKFLDENAEAAKNLKDRARGFIGVLEYGKLTADAPVVSEANMAEDPKGPKDGWSFKTTFTNSGDKTISWCSAEVQLLDATGKSIKQYPWPLVGPAGPGGVPVTEETTKPLEPGKTRTWEYTLSKTDAPTDWSQQVRIVALAIRFPDTAANDGAKPQ